LLGQGIGGEEKKGGRKRASAFVATNWERKERGEGGDHSVLPGGEEEGERWEVLPLFPKTQKRGGEKRGIFILSILSAPMWGKGRKGKAEKNSSPFLAVLVLWEKEKKRERGWGNLLGII